MNTPAFRRYLTPAAVHTLCDLAESAGDAIMAIYDGGDFETRRKDDDSPLTAADLASNRVIAAGLAKMKPGLPVLSEESGHASFDQRRGWEAFWLVDPLDGTKEFIKRNGEFTVNIALVAEGRPVLGVVHAPALGRTYWGAEGLGAFLRREGADEAISVVERVEEPVTVVVSRSHLRERDEAFIAAMSERYGTVKKAPTGSSLKLCRVAEGEADVYPRFGPTMEWDIAAAEAVLEQAGGVIETPEGEKLGYNKESLVNPHFVARTPALELPGG